MERNDHGSMAGIAWCTLREINPRTKPGSPQTRSQFDVSGGRHAARAFSIPSCDKLKFRSYTHRITSPRSTPVAYRSCSEWRSFPVAHTGAKMGRYVNPTCRRTNQDSKPIPILAPR